ncbi:MAG: hypothetical protein ABIG96_06430 [Candidatus Micrarchaeota archaeon]
MLSQALAGRIGIKLAPGALRYGWDYDYESNKNVYMFRRNAEAELLHLISINPVISFIIRPRKKTKGEVHFSMKFRVPPRDILAVCIPENEPENNAHKMVLKILTKFKFPVYNLKGDLIWAPQSGKK